MSSTRRAAIGLVFLASLGQGTEPVLRLKTGGALEPLPAAVESPANRSLFIPTGTRIRMVLQFREAPGWPERLALSDRGANVLAYIPDNAWVVSAPAGMSLEGLDLVQAGLLTERHKLSPLLTATPDADPPPVLVKFHGDVDGGEARRLALNEGLDILEHPDLPSAHLLVRGDAARMTAYNEVQYVLPASEELRTGRAVSACLSGRVGSVRAASALFEFFGEGWDGPGLNPATIGFWFGQLAPTLTRTDARAQFERAMAEWAAVVRLSFIERAAPRSMETVDVEFAPLTALSACWHAPTILPPIPNPSRATCSLMPTNSGASTRTLTCSPWPCTKWDTRSASATAMTHAR
jgi:hypothetical protein